VLCSLLPTTKHNTYKGFRNCLLICKFISPTATRATVYFTYVSLKDMFGRGIPQPLIGVEWHCNLVGPVHKKTVNN
jgi:hypothetical protein